jgi:amino ABC transporter, permease protein, 3-TM region, his/glu/gln/arg/opine family
VLLAAAFFTPGDMMDKILDTALLMLEGSTVTLEIFCVTLALSLPLGFFVALGRLSRSRILGRLIDFYIWVMRGTPLMLQLLFVYFALPMIGIKLSDLSAAFLAFVLNYAAYFAEIFRAGIQAVPRGQYEAARVLGMSYPLALRRIILPQVLRITLPPVSNETINLVKDTSLVYILAMNDLLRVARTIVQREFDMTPLVIAGAFYLAMTAAFTWGFKKLEAHYGRYDR